MTATPTDFQSSYSSAFDVYLREPSEVALHAAYELGRDAVARELSILELAGLHHDALQAALRENAPSRGTDEVVAAANEFFQETLSAFEMVRRGFRDARDAVALEKQRATIVRQLSDFLADSSVALHGPDSLAEILQLVAEQARELTGSACSVARVVIDGADPMVTEALSYPDADGGWQEFLAGADLARLASSIESGRKSLRLSRPDVPGRSFCGWLGATLEGWDEQPLGSIHVFDRAHEFSETDEAVVVHLAQMAVTAIERARRSV